MELNYEDIPAMLEENDPLKVLKIPILVSIYDDDQVFCENICLKLAGHENVQVRANAVLGFGHIARRFGVFLNKSILDIVNEALLDDFSEVRGQADCAADDIECYLNVKLSNHTAT